MRRMRIRDLYRCAVSVQPRHYDWRNEDYGDRWEYWEAAECQELECDAVLVVRGEEKHCNLDPESKCEGYLLGEGPMMNTFWPLPAFSSGGKTFADPDDTAKTLARLPVCLVNIGVGPEDEDEWGLALTGGGMDLSWELAEAYMLCGYLPPLELCSLPAFAGKRLDTRARWIVAGCKASCRASMDYARGQLSGLQSVRKKMAGVKEA